MGQPDHTLSLPHTEHHQETQPPSPATSHHQGSSDPFPQGTCSHTKVQKVLLGMLPCQTRGSPLTQVGHQVDQAHEQQAPDAEHHEQEEEQDGGHRFHSVVAQMPLWEAHVHQLPVEVVEGGQRSSQPGTCLLLLLAGTRASWSGPVAPMEKALSGTTAASRCRCRSSGPHPGVIVLHNLPIGQDPHHPGSGCEPW